MENSDTINSKKHFKDMLKRYGYCLPRGDSFCSVEYMADVLGGRCYAPKYVDVRLRPCPKPPLREVLLAEVELELQKQRKTLGDCSKQMPDTGFLLTCLSTLNPQHRFFARDYSPPPVKRKKAVVRRVLDMPADFFQGQPKASAKAIRKGCNKTKNMLLKIQKVRRGEESDEADQLLDEAEANLAK